MMSTSTSTHKIETPETGRRPQGRPSHKKKSLAEIAVETKETTARICSKLPHHDPTKSERFPFTDDLDEYPLLLKYLDPSEVPCPKFRVRWPSTPDGPGPSTEYAFGTTIRILIDEKWVPIPSFGNPKLAPDTSVSQEQRNKFKDHDEPLNAALAMPTKLNYVQEDLEEIYPQYNNKRELTTALLEKEVATNVNLFDNVKAQGEMVSRVAIVNISAEFNTVIQTQTDKKKDSDATKTKGRMPKGPTPALCYRTTLAAALRRDRDDGTPGMVQIPGHCGLYTCDVVVLRTSAAEGHRLLWPDIKARNLPVVSVLSMPGVEIRNGDIEDGYELVNLEDDDDTEGGHDEGAVQLRTREDDGPSLAGIAAGGTASETTLGIRHDVHVNKQRIRRGERVKERHRKIETAEWEEPVIPKPSKEWSPVRRALKRKVRMCLRMLAIKGHVMVVVVLGTVWFGSGLTACGAMDRLWMEMECWLDVLNEAEFSGGFFKEVWFSVFERGRYEALGGYEVFEKRFDGEVVGMIH